MNGREGKSFLFDCSRPREKRKTSVIYRVGTEGLMTEHKAIKNLLHALCVGALQ